MSTFARWTYTNTATVRPFLRLDQKTQEPVYGPEYTIACTWRAEGMQERNAGGQSGSQGAEMVLKQRYYFEDPRPKMLDLIRRNGATLWEEIRSVLEDDMSPFDEADSPDYQAVT